MASLSEDTPNLGGYRVATEEDILSWWSYEEDIPIRDQKTHSPPNYDFPLCALQQSGKRGCETCWKLVYYFLPFLNLWPHRVDDGMLSWQKGELRWRLVEKGEGESWIHYWERRFNICSFREVEEKGKNLSTGSIIS